MCGPPHYNEHNDLFEYNPHVLKRVLTYIFYFIILVAFSALYGKLSWLILKATITSIQAIYETIKITWAIL